MISSATMHGTQKSHTTQATIETVVSSFTGLPCIARAPATDRQRSSARPWVMTVAPAQSASKPKHPGPVP